LDHSVPWAGDAFIALVRTMAFDVSQALTDNVRGIAGRCRRHRLLFHLWALPAVVLHARDVSKQTVDATVISSIATWAGYLLHHDTRRSRHATRWEWRQRSPDVGPLSPRFRVAAAAAAVEIYATTVIHSFIHSSGHNFACQSQLLPKLPCVCSRQLATQKAATFQSVQAPATETGNQSVIGRVAVTTAS